MGVEQFLGSHHGTLYGLIFFCSFGGVALWEAFAPRRRLRASLPLRWSGNLGCLLINGLLLWGIYGSWGVGAAIVASDFQWGLLQQVALPYWVEFTVALLLLDLGHYAIHWAFHKVPMLWRMHRLHHSDQDFDLTTGSRFHPLEAVLEHGANLLVVVLVGPPTLAILLFVLAYGLTTYWVHGNIRMPAGWDRRIRRLFITPDMHRTHHSQVEQETNSNYGGLFSFWDRLFGNYVDEPRGGHEGMAIGLREFSDARHIRLDWMLRNPLLPVVAHGQPDLRGASGHGNRHSPSQ